MSDKLVDATRLGRFWTNAKAYIDGKCSKTSTTATITASGWTNNSKKVTVSGVTASNTVIVTPQPAYIDAYVAAGLKCTAQSANKLTFSYKKALTASVKVNVLILD